MIASSAELCLLMAVFTNRVREREFGRLHLRTANVEMTKLKSNTPL
jgi:hypothetical protein